MVTPMTKNRKLEAILKRVSTYSIASQLFNRGISPGNRRLHKYIKEEIAAAYRAKGNQIGYDTGDLFDALTRMNSDTRLTIKGGIVQLEVDHPGAYWWGRRGNLGKVVPDIDMRRILKRALDRFLADRRS